MDASFNACKKPEYHPLDSSIKEFRVVDIYPAEERTSLVRCTLRHESLSRQPLPRYETVSYVWGDPMSRDTMEVNGVAVDVPASSVAALQRMRLQTGLQTLWIDALCINQKDVRERSEQVRMMAKVYKSSRGNLIYLGEVRDVQKTEMALSDIKAIIDEMNEETENLTVVDDTVFDPWREGMPKLAGSGLRFQIHEDVLESQIFGLPWFRLWVFQEAALAPNNICILGDYTFRLLDIAHASLWIAHKQKYVSKTLINSFGRGVASALFEYIDGGHGLYATNLLAQLMSDTYEMLATDPREKLYAILGLRDWPEGIPELLAPNYSKAEAQVFRDASRFSLSILEENGLAGLESLNAHDEDLKRDSFLSWVIFPARGYDSVWEPEILQAHLFSCSDKKEQPWPSGQSTSNVDVEVLNVAGVFLDRVESVSLPLTRHVASEAQALDSWLSSTLSIVRDFKSDESGALAAVLIAGANADQELATREDSDSLGDFQWSLQDVGRIPAVFDPTGASAGDHTDQRDPHSKAIRYLFAFQRACINRVIFRTTKNYFGVGSNLLREGDTVAILYGADVPFALRSNERDQYQILAPCYVHGIMFGEAVRQHRECGEKDFLFSIR